MRAPLLLLGFCVGLALLLVASGSGLRPVTRADAAELAAASTATPAAEADAATGAEVLKACGGCHSIATLSQHPQDAAGWSRTVQSMEQLGAQVPATDRAAILDYLARHFGAQ